jgi:hypothetical protein
MKSLIEFIREIGNMPNTFWGIIVLLLSMRIATHYNAEIGYYFAGVGSTLCGITHLQNKSLSLNTPQGSASAEVNSNASDSPS